MDTLRIDLINPKARKLLENLEALNLIAIKRDEGMEFKKLLKKLRKNSNTAPSLEEITLEVEAARQERYGK